MSFAIHLFIEEKFCEKSYREFLGELQHLYGEWQLEDPRPISEDTRYYQIHECWIKPPENQPDEFCRIFVAAERKVKSICNWGFEFEWKLTFETSTGRTALGLAIQLGGLLLATYRFRFLLAFDHDTCLKDEPTEFRTIEAIAKHIKRLLEEEFGSASVKLQRRGIVSSKGYLLLPG